MNIVIQNTTSDGFLSAIGKVLHRVGHNILIWNPENRTIYEMLQQTKPNLLFINEEFKSAHFSLLTNANYISYNRKDELGKAVLNIAKISEEDSFADVMNYKSSYSDDSLSGDVLISTNYSDSKELIDLSKRIYDQTNYRLKCVGVNSIDSPFYIGRSELGILPIASSNKLTVTTDLIERDSLLYNGILSCLVEDFDECTKIMNDRKSKSKYIKEKKKNIQTSLQITEKILRAISLPEDADKVKLIEGEA